MVPAGVSSFVSSQTSGLRGYNITNIAVPAFLCTLLFMLYLDNISYFRCREARRALNAKGSKGGGWRGAWGGKECSPSLGGELLGSHGVIAQLGLPALAPQAQGFYGLVCTSRGYGWCRPLPKGMSLRGGAAGMGLRLPAATSRQA